MPRRQRKTLVAILLILAVAAVAVFTWWYTQRAPERYSKYGFSFEYPKGMLISELGHLENTTATSSSGILLGELSNDELELIKVGWLSTESAPDLEISLNDSFLSLEAEGLEVDRGQLVNSTKVNGHEMIYQYFDGTIAEALTFHGISGVWYCDINNKNYDFVVMYSGSEQDVLSKFQQYIASFICH